MTAHTRTILSGILLLVVIALIALNLKRDRDRRRHGRAGKRASR